MIFSHKLGTPLSVVITDNSLLDFVGPQFSDKSQILQMFSRHLLEPTGLVYHLLLKRVDLW